MESIREHYLRRALSAARPWVGATWPNPAVGACVIDAGGRLLGEGAHRQAGGEHAEVAAIADARSRGHDPRDATLYVTLEPCNHHGRTPPCTAAILEAGIARVVVACGDDNPRVLGGGAQALRAQGVQVDFASRRWQLLARELNAAYFETDGAARAHVTLKLAISSDGKLARRFGRVESAAERAISGERAHRRAHRLRAESSCVLVGRGTVLADRPRLDVRLVAATRQPRALILDSMLALEPRVLPAGSLVAHSPQAPREAREMALGAGHELLEIGRTATGLDWQSLLRELAGRGLGKLLVEGGAQVAATLIEAGLADRIHLFQAPFAIPGAAPTAPDLPPPGYELCLRRRLGADEERIYRRGGATDETGRA